MWVLIWLSREEEGRQAGLSSRMMLSGRVSQITRLELLTQMEDFQDPVSG